MFVLSLPPPPFFPPALLRHLPRMGHSRAQGEVDAGTLQKWALSWVKWTLSFPFKPDGRKCRLCPHVDSAEDPVSKAILLTP